MRTQRKEQLWFYTVINTLTAHVTLQFHHLALKICELHQDLLIESQMCVQCYLAQIINKTVRRS